MRKRKRKVMRCHKKFPLQVAGKAGLRRVEPKVKTKTKRKRIHPAPNRRTEIRKRVLFQSLGGKGMKAPMPPLLEGEEAG
jgi:hypothetical protein